MYKEGRRMDKDNPIGKHNPVIKIENVRVKPKYIAQGCPVCNTWGTLRHGTKTCQACEGKGYILIPSEEIKNEYR